MVDITKKQVCDPYIARSSRLNQPMEGNAKRTIQDLLTNPITSIIQKLEMSIPIEKYLTKGRCSNSASLEVEQAMNIGYNELTKIYPFCFAVLGLSHGPASQE